MAAGARFFRRRAGRAPAAALSPPPETLKPKQKEQENTMTEAEFPPIETIRERMAEAYHEPPQAVLPPPIAAHAGEYHVPHLWALRPDRADEIDGLLAAAAALPLTNNPLRDPNPPQNGELDNVPAPQHVAKRGSPFGAAWLASARQDAILSGGQVLSPDTPEAAYGGRKITRLDTAEWQVSSACGALRARLQRIQSYEWALSAEFEVDTGEGYPLLVDHHPDGGSPDLNQRWWRTHADFIGHVAITPMNVYGSAWIDLKALSHFDAVDIAIRWLSIVEWAYGLAERPAWLDGGPGPGEQDGGSDAPLDAGGDGRVDGPGAGPAGGAGVGPSGGPAAPAAPETPLEMAIAAAEAEEPAGEPDELQAVLEEVTAARKAAKADIAGAKAAAAAASELRRQADEADRLAAEAEARAEPGRQVLREQAGKLLELLQADEDFPGIG